MEKKGFISKFKKFFNLVFLNAEPPLDELQAEVIENITNMMSKSDAVLLIAPISNVCYIQWRKYFIRFGNSAATITNTNYSYYFWLPEQTTDRLKTMFYEKVEERKKRLDQDYDKKTLENLKIIAQEIENE